MKNKIIALTLLLLTACYTEPQFKKTEYQHFGISKFPAVIVTVDSRNACLNQPGCNYTNKFINELVATEAFHNVDINNPAAKYRIRINFRASDINTDSLYSRTSGIVPSDVKQNFGAEFVIEDENRIVYTYEAQTTGVKTAHAFMRDSRDTMLNESITTMVSSFVANIQQNNVLPVSEGY